MEIKKAIKNLYKVFDFYIIDNGLMERSSGLSVFEKETNLLLSIPLSKLSEDEIGHFMRSAITTFGDENDYKHFLPRILELLLYNDNLIDDFLTFEKLNYSNWKSWNQKEVKAIEEYFLCLWIDTLKGEYDNQYFENVFLLALNYLKYDIVFYKCP